MTTLPLRIALRYLFSRKSYHVINMISGIGAAGMAIGTAALVVILSVFNGFDSLVSQSLTDAHPDLVIKPAAGKVFRPDSLSWLVEEPSIVRLSSVLEDQAFLSCDGKQGLVLVKGVDLAAEEESPLKAHMIDGVWQLHRGDRAMAVAGAGLAAQLGLNPRFLAPLELHYPSRTEAISLANPAASLRSVKLGLAGVLSVSSELDAKLLVVPIGTVRELLGYETEVSALEIWTAPEQAQALQKALQERLGTHFRVLDRYQQNASVYKMMRYEKLAIFLILIFVVLIIAFNIYSSLRMLVIEKEADIATLRSMGATDSLVRRIFRLEGWLVSLVGIVIGLVLGVALVLLQQQLGLVPMPGNFIVDAYPVVLRASDLLWTVAGVALIGYLMALLPTRRL
jgi:ABC-type lipoprotein release transport system permease subunit